MDWLGLHFISSLPESAIVILNCSHSLLLVVLSYLVASAAGFAALDLADRVQAAAETVSRRVWQCAGAFCMGGGIWSMHFIAMLAFQAPVPVGYDLTITFISLAVAILVSGLAMLVIGRPQRGYPRFIAAAVLVGIGIASMHYTGMAAIDSPARQYYDPWLFALSVVIAIAASLAALTLAVYLRGRSDRQHLLFKYIGSLVMGGAIVSMHFTGMAALTLVVPAGTEFTALDNGSTLQLGLSIGLITILIIGAAVGAAYADKKLSAKDRDLLRANALVQELDQAHSSLRQVAHYDPLTNMYNRRAFNEMFERMLASHAERGLSLAVMFLDVDHFKRINDTLGHQTGDELLKIIARRLQETMREGDVVARFGGDEFCLLATLRDREEARMIAHRLLARMREPVALAKRTLVMTTSVGISVFPDDGDNCEDLLKHADLALYQSKKRGRNTTHFFHRNLEAKAELDLQLEEELREALKRNRLQVLYQPMMRLADKRVVSIEALVRWPHPELGLLEPNRFIAVAEANGCIAELDGWVLRRACADLRDLHQAGFRGLRVAVNLSGLNLPSRDLIDQVAAAIAGSGISAQQLELEITENALMSNLKAAKALLPRLRDLGVSLTIDDFGIGHSSLAYLQQLALDGLKIDSSFLRDIPKDPGAKEITSAIIAMAHKLKLTVTAEGVDTIGQQSFLSDNGCDRGQGWLVSEPLTFTQLQQFLPSHTPAPLQVIAGDS